MHVRFDFSNGVPFHFHAIIAYLEQIIISVFSIATGILWLGWCAYSQTENASFQGNWREISAATAAIYYIAYFPIAILQCFIVEDRDGIPVAYKIIGLFRPHPMRKHIRSLASGREIAPQILERHTQPSDSLYANRVKERQLAELLRKVSTNTDSLRELDAAKTAAMSREAELREAVLRSALENATINERIRARDRYGMSDD